MKPHAIATISHWRHGQIIKPSSQMIGNWRQQYPRLLLLKHTTHSLVRSRKQTFVSE